MTLTRTSIAMPSISDYQAYAGIAPSFSVLFIDVSAAVTTLLALGAFVYLWTRKAKTIPTIARNRSLGSEIAFGTVVAPFSVFTQASIILAHPFNGGLLASAGLTELLPLYLAVGLIGYQVPLSLLFIERQRALFIYLLVYFILWTGVEVDMAAGHALWNMREPNGASISYATTLTVLALCCSLPAILLNLKNKARK